MPTNAQQLAWAGGHLAYRAQGADSAPAVVLLHGIGSTSVGWTATLAALAPQLRVFAWDAPGYGGSTPLTVAHATPADYAAALAALLDGLALPRVHLVASSWATLTALAFTRTQPGRVASLVLSGPSAGYGSLPAEERATLLHARGARARNAGIGAMLAQDSPKLLAPGAPAAMLAGLAAGQAGVQLPGYLQALDALFAADGLHLMAGLAQPTLVLSGDADVVAPPAAHAERLAAAASHGRLVNLPGCGHLPHVERPDVFCDAVRAHVLAHH